MSSSDQIFQGSFSFNSAGAGTVIVAGSGTSCDWEVTTTYIANNINPDLRVTLKIGDESFVVAPGLITSTHKGKGTQVSYECEFLAGVQLTVGWSAACS